MESTKTNCTKSLAWYYQLLIWLVVCTIFFIVVKLHLVDSHIKSINEHNQVIETYLKDKV